MRIASQPKFTQSQKQLNFESVNLIKVSKKAFKNPDDLLEVSNTFAQAVNNITGEVHTRFSDFFSRILYGYNKNKTVGFLEQPKYLEIMQELKRLGGGLNLDWLSLHTGTKVNEPISKDYHSFYVLTKGNKDDFSIANSVAHEEKLFPINSYAMAKRLANPDEEYYDDKLRLLVEKNGFLLDIINPAESDIFVHNFEIKNLKQLPKVFKEIDY